MIDFLPPPRLVHTLHMEIGVGRPIEIGATSAGIRRVVPITGGSASGPLLSGRILAGGADFQLIPTATETRLEARYIIETDFDEYIYVENVGMRIGAAEDIALLREDKPVDPSRIYSGGTPRFETASPRLSLLMSRIFVAIGARRPNTVILDVFAVERDRPESST